MPQYGGRERGNMKRVVITGLGTVNPLGSTVEKFWENIKKGTLGVSKIDSFDTTELGVSVAGIIRDFDPAEYFDRKDIRHMERFTQIAVASAIQALQDAGTDFKDMDPYRVGTIIGCGIGGIGRIEEEHDKYRAKGPGRISPFFVPMMIGNMAAGQVAIRTGFRGDNFCTTTACASATHAIGEAFRKIKDGYLDVCLCGGSESTITEFTLGGFRTMKALTTETDPAKASTPFDLNRGGFVLGEGSAVLVLEEYEHAKARGAKIYCELAGYGATCDAYHITSPAEDGSGAAKAMEFAMKDAGITPEQLDYVNAHGTSTHHNDLFETKAIKLALGAHANKVKINSTKSMIGHLLGAAGGVEFITCVKSIEDGYVHPTVGLENPGEGCDLDYTMHEGVSMDVNYAISNSLGFGGHNASLIVKKFTA